MGQLSDIVSYKRSITHGKKNEILKIGRSSQHSICLTSLRIDVLQVVDQLAVRSLSALCYPFSGTSPGGMARVLEDAARPLVRSRLKNARMTPNAKESDAAHKTRY